MTPEAALRSLSGDIRNQDDYDHRLQARIMARSNLSYPFIDVGDLQVALAWMIFDSEGKTSRVESVSDQDREELGITYDMLLAAIEEAGGALNRSGQYPINVENIGKLRRVHAVEV
jgi:hypothetical protein